MRRPTRVVLRHLPPHVVRAHMVTALSSYEGSILTWEFHESKQRALADASRPATAWITFHKAHLDGMAKFIDWVNGGGLTELFRQQYDELKEQHDIAAAAQASNPSPLPQPPESASAPSPSATAPVAPPVVREVPLAPFVEWTTSIEWAPQQKLPRKRRVKDSKMNTIQQDPDYLAFVESLEKKPEGSPTAAGSGNASIPSVSSLLTSSAPAASSSIPLPISMMQPRIIPIIEFLKETQFKQRDAKLREKERERLTARQLKAALKGGKGGVDVKGGKGEKKSKAVLRSEEKKKLQLKKKAKEKLKREAAKRAAEGGDAAASSSSSGAASSALENLKSAGEKLAKKRAERAAEKAAEKAAKQAVKLAAKQAAKQQQKDSHQAQQSPSINPAQIQFMKRPDSASQQHAAQSPHNTAAASSADPSHQSQQQPQSARPPREKKERPPRPDRKNKGAAPSDHPTESHGTSDQSASSTPAPPTPGVPTAAVLSSLLSGISSGAVDIGGSGGSGKRGGGRGGGKNSDRGERGGKSGRGGKRNEHNNNNINDDASSHSELASTSNEGGGRGGGRGGHKNRRGRGGGGRGGRSEGDRGDARPTSAHGDAAHPAASPLSASFALSQSAAPFNPAPQPFSRIRLKENHDGTQ